MGAASLLRITITTSVTAMDGASPSRSRSRSPSVRRRSSSQSRDVAQRTTPTPSKRRQQFPVSFEQSEPLTKPHTVSVLLLLIAFVGYTGFARNSFTHGEEAVGGAIANKFTNIKT